MDETEVTETLNILAAQDDRWKSRGLTIKGRIVNYVRANIDDFMDAYEGAY